ncbi:MAG TPA: amidohydrolase, partial [Candidatus Saccharimonadia bacterium]|nr:amidohydrolase [Candidatus Saccharimonadia bacterium]
MAASSAALLGSVCEKHRALMAQTTSVRAEIVDIHQHTNYHSRTDADLISHQEAMGVTKTILLPAGSDALRPSTHN